MIRICTTIIVVIINCFTIYSQLYDEYFDSEYHLYGIKSKLSNQTIIEAKYSEILDIKDSLVSVRQHGSYGIVNLKDNVVVKFTKDPAYFDYNDTTNQRFIETGSKSIKSPKISYYIDSKRNCLPTIEMPCPYWKDLKIETLPKILYYTQKAEYYKSVDKLDSCLVYNDSAIYMENNNLYTYLNFVKNILYDKEGNFIENNQFVNENLINKTDSHLIKCYSLPIDNFNIAEINFYRYQIHKNITNNRSKLKEIQRINKKNNIDEIIWGVFLFPGINHYSNTELEIGIGSGITKRNNSLNFRNIGSIWSGLSYIKSINDNINAFKLHIVTVIKPISGGLYPILYTDFKTTDLVLRPEIGIGIYNFTLSIGFNHIVDQKIDFKEHIDKVSVSFRYYIPIINSTIFSAN